MYVFRLLGFLRPYKGRMALAFLSVLAASAFVLAMPQIIRWAIDYGLGLERRGGGLVATGERHLLVLAAVAIVAAALFRGLSPSARPTWASGSASASPTTCAIASTTACSASPTPTTTASRPAS